MTADGDKSKVGTWTSPRVLLGSRDGICQGTEGASGKWE